MNLNRLQTPTGPRWALDGRLLAPHFQLSMMLEIPRAKSSALLDALASDEKAEGRLLPPIEAHQEVWASGVTYLRSREARVHESETKDIYTKVYDAKRPELFFKASGWRVAGHGMPIRVRKDSRWNAPEPELVLVINSRSEIVGYCAGNDVSSRDIEGENPLYLPQAKIYNGSCALGPGIRLIDPAALTDLPIALDIERGGNSVFHGETRTSRIKRPLAELAEYLGLELDLPQGAFLFTGTGIVPPDDFSLAPGDRVRIAVGDLVLENPVHG
ncbi:MAG: fumarylacetoacetate hydrolase family protein [Gammaproteobacteria bacterium]